MESRSKGGRCIIQVMIKRVNLHASAKDKCDSIFSKLVTSRGVCVHCGTTDIYRLQCAHIIPRRYSAVRTNLTNALCLCYKCHYFYTNNPAEFLRFVFTVITETTYDELWQQARTPTKMDWESELNRLKLLQKNA
jgi:hypothetical protein